VTEQTIEMTISEAAIAELAESLFRVNGPEGIASRMPCVAHLMSRRRELIASSRETAEKPPVARRYLAVFNGDMEA
jgi:hypothetical protein